MRKFCHVTFAAIEQVVNLSCSVIKQGCDIKRTREQKLLWKPLAVSGRFIRQLHQTLLLIHLLTTPAGTVMIMVIMEVLATVVGANLLL